MREERPRGRGDDDDDETATATTVGRKAAVGTSWPPLCSACAETEVGGGGGRATHGHASTSWALQRGTCGGKGRALPHVSGGWACVHTRFGWGRHMHAHYCMLLVWWWAHTPYIQVYTHAHARACTRTCMHTYGQLIGHRTQCLRPWVSASASVGTPSSLPPPLEHRVHSCPYAGLAAHVVLSPNAHTGRGGIPQAARPGFVGGVHPRGSTRLSATCARAPIGPCVHVRTWRAAFWAACRPHRPGCAAGMTSQMGMRCP